MSQNYERKCKNWLETFSQWTLPRSEAKESFIFWAGVFTLSSALRRRVFIPKRYMGGWTCYPHMYIMFVAPPGLRKTTTMGYAIDLLDQCKGINKAPTFITSAAIIDSIVKADDSAIYMTIEEFGDIVLKGGLEMYEFLTSMFDGKKNIEAKTISRGVEFAQSPCINMLGATTPEWISANMPEAVIGGGFASRVVFVYEKETRIKRMYYRDVMRAYNFKAMEEDLIADLNHIALNIQGEFDISEEALEFMEDWYQTKHNTIGVHKKLQGYMQRKPVHIHKLAQILAIAESDELMIHPRHFQAAISIIEQTEVHLPKVFAGVGKNKYAIDIKDIAGFILERNTVSKDELLREFSANAEPQKLEELVNGLVAMKMVEAYYDDERKGVVYRKTKILG